MKMSPGFTDRIEKVFAKRLPLLAGALARPFDASKPVFDNLHTLIDASNPAEVWLALAVLSGRIPTSEQVIETTERAQSDREAIYAEATRLSTSATLEKSIEVITDKTLVDVAHTSRNPISSGIQRVTRELSRAWAANPDVVFIQFHHSDRMYRLLTPTEEHCLLNSEFDLNRGDDFETAQVVIPWRCHFFCPELPTDRDRAEALSSLARFSNNVVSVLGHDAIPITTGETVVPNMPGNYGLFLRALQDVDFIAATCESSANEFVGWRDIFATPDHPGPKIGVVYLPTGTASAVPDDVLLSWRRRLLFPGEPMVLCVGSHEPRKNHLAVLYAAERLWDEGFKFSLVFIGGYSWMSDEYFIKAETMIKAGYHLELYTAVEEDMLWSAYRLATFSVFPSLNEGFGLPIAESLSVGTPVITSDFGSMAEIAQDGGCLLIDPRDDDSLYEGMKLLLTDPKLVNRLREEAQKRPPRTWQQYADDMWEAINSIPTKG